MRVFRNPIAKWRRNKGIRTLHSISHDKSPRSNVGSHDCTGIYYSLTDDIIDILGKPAIGLNQLLTSFFYHDTKYTVKMVEIEKGVLVKHPESLHNEPDLMALVYFLYSYDSWMVLDTE